MSNVMDNREVATRITRVRVRNTHIPSLMDEAVKEALRRIVENIEDFEDGAASPRRGLFVAGAAGTGKSTALRHAFATMPELRSWTDEYGENVRTLISVKLPKRCQTKDIVVAVLKEMNLPHEGSEHVLTDFLLEQIRERRVKILHLDELQHTVRSNTKIAFEAVQDFLKQLIDREDWPLHVICSGLPKIENMRKDEQIGRRSTVVPFYALQFPPDASIIAKLVRDVVEVGCELTLDEELTRPEFHHRLCRATGGAWGTMIETIQTASFLAISRGRKVLTIRHFARGYEATSGCSDHENIFLSPNFENIDPSQSLASLTED